MEDRSLNNRAPHEQLLLGLSEEAYQLWRHNPVTGAYLHFLEDQLNAFRTAAADLLEAGKLEPGSDVLRGRMLTLRELHELKLSDIHGFYRQVDTEEAKDDAAAPDQRDSR